MAKKIIQKSGAIVHESAIIAEGVTIWHGAQIARNVKIGKNTIIGNNVYIDAGVVIGANCKIQSGASIFSGVFIKEGVFIGPHVCFTNDKYPRAVNKNGKIKTAGEWEVSKTIVQKGASIGANATILPGIRIGKFAMVGAGSVVTKNISSNSLVFGNPAKIYGKVNINGIKIAESKHDKR